MKIIFSFISALILLLLISAPVAAAPPDNPMHGKPDFNEHIYADGSAWGTKVGPLLPAPNGHNNHSFDMIFPVIYDGVDAQLPVAEAGPGNSEYNGGRWAVYPAIWNVPPHAVFTFYENKGNDPEDYFPGGVPNPADDDWNNLAAHVALGHLTISSKAVLYFECPLLPVK